MEQIPEELWERIARTDEVAFWEQRLTASRGGAITVGRSLASGSDVTVSLRDLATHCHVVGASGVGKSFFIEGICKRLIDLGFGLCLITPHEDIYRRVLAFCAHRHVRHPERRLAQRVIPFDVAETQRIIGFNPVARNARVLSYQVAGLMEAIRKAWGQLNFYETPRLARWIHNTLHGVVEPELTLLQAKTLVTSTPDPLRQAIIRRIQNRDVRAEWEWIISQKSREQDERLESTFNRIREFAGHELIRLIVGQQQGTLDFADVLRRRKILLVNLAKQNVVSEDNQRLLGSLVLNELLTAAFARPERERTPYAIIIDEFQHFATRDVCDILDGGRKFGLHLIVAHQHLHQLKRTDPEVYYSTMTNARTKVVFGGLSDEDLDAMAPELYTGELDPNEIKHEIWQTKMRPVETTRIIATDSETSGGSVSQGTISHRSIAENRHYIADSGFLRFLPDSGSQTKSESSGKSESENSSWQRGRSVARVPWYENHEYQELTSATFRSLEEQLYIKKAQLKRQPRQHAAILVPERRVELVRTPTLAEFPVSDRHVKAFVEECMDAARCYKTPAAIEREIQALEAKLLAPEPITITTTAEPAAKTIDDEDLY